MQTPRPAAHAGLPRYAKTQAGIDEIADRRLGLQPRLRRLLILVDGRRDASELSALLAGDIIDSQLDALEACGLIAAVRGAGKPAPPPVTEAPPPSEFPAATPIAAATPTLPPQQLERARALMTDSARRYLGVFGAPLLAGIARAADRDTLRSVSAAWHMALRESRDGRAHADELLQTLRELIDLG